jgi:hypothetical protein
MHEFMCTLRISLTWYNSFHHFQKVLRMLSVSQEGDDYEVVSKAPLVISRIVYKNNTAKYLIGDRASTYSEVADLLKGKGIDFNNNCFLIVQVITNISQANEMNTHRAEAKLLTVVVDGEGKRLHIR